MSYSYSSVGALHVTVVTNKDDGDMVQELPRSEPGHLFSLSSVETGEVSLTSNLNPNLDTDVVGQSFGELVSESTATDERGRGSLTLFGVGNNTWVLQARNGFDYAVKYERTSPSWEQDYVSSGTPIVPRAF